MAERSVSDGDIKNQGIFVIGLFFEYTSLRMDCSVAFRV